MTRQRLPNRRDGETVEFDHDGLRYTACCDPERREMFLDAGKTGTSVNIMAKESAVMFSIARQHGVPLDELASALPRLGDGSPAGPVGTAINAFATPQPGKAG